MRQSILAESRTHTTRSGLRQLRDAGRIPCIVFGRESEPTMLHISAREFQLWARRAKSQIIELSVGNNEKIPAVVEDVQRDPVSRKLIHVDFMRIRMDEVIRTKLPIELVGTPAGAKIGGILQTQSNAIDVEGLPAQLPASITVDVSHLDIGDALLVRDLKIPDSITLLSDADELIASVLPPQLEQDTEADADEEPTDNEAD